VGAGDKWSVERAENVLKKKAQSGRLGDGDNGAPNLGEWGWGKKGEKIEYRFRIHCGI